MVSMLPVPAATSLTLVARLSSLTLRELSLKVLEPHAAYRALEIDAQRCGRVSR